MGSRIAYEAAVLLRSSIRFSFTLLVLIQSDQALASSLLGQLHDSEPPSEPLSSTDSALSALAKSLSSLPDELDFDLESSPLCPFDAIAPEGIRILHSGAVDDRVRLIQAQLQGNEGVEAPPQIQIEPPDPDPVANAEASQPDDSSRRSMSTMTRGARNLHLTVNLHPFVVAFRDRCYVFDFGGPRTLHCHGAGNRACRPRSR